MRSQEHSGSSGKASRRRTGAPPSWIHRALLFGVAPPAPGAGPVGRLRFVRDLQRRYMIVFVPIVVIALIWGGGSATQLVFAGVVVLVLADHVRLSLRVRRAERAE